MSDNRQMEEVLVTTRPVEPSTSAPVHHHYSTRNFGDGAEYKRRQYYTDDYRAYKERSEETAEGPPTNSPEEIVITAKQLSQYDALIKYLELNFNDMMASLEARHGPQMVIDKPPMYRWNKQAVAAPQTYEEIVITAKALSRFIPQLRTLNNAIQVGLLTKNMWDQFVNDELIRIDYETQEAIDYGVPALEETFTYATYQKYLAHAQANSPLSFDYTNPGSNWAKTALSELEENNEIPEIVVTAKAIPRGHKTTINIPLEFIMASTVAIPAPALTLPVSEIRPEHKFSTDVILDSYAAPGDTTAAQGIRSEERFGAYDLEQALPIGSVVQSVANGQLQLVLTQTRAISFEENMLRHDRKSGNASGLIRSIYKLVNKTYGTYTEIADLTEAISRNIIIDGTFASSMSLEQRLRKLMCVYQGKCEIEIDFQQMALDIFMMELIDSVIGRASSYHGKVAADQGWYIDRPPKG